MNFPTIYDLLKLSRLERKEKIKEFHYGEKQKIFDSIITLTEILELDKIESYEERVKLRHEWIQSHPDEVWWDYGEYLSSKNVLSILKYKVSTNGDTAIYNSIRSLHVRSNNDDVVHSDNTIYKCIFDENRSVNLNRVITSTFLPISEHLKSFPISILQSNHINGKTLDNRLSNLEWTTIVGNIRHGMGHEEYANFDYLLVEVVIDNGFKGRKFVINRYTDELPKEFNDHIPNWKDKKCFLYGMVCKPIEIEKINNYERGFPKEITDMLSAHPEYFDIRIKPLAGKILVGKYKGLEFSLIGDSEINTYFYRHSIILAISSLSKYNAGCIWKEVTMREAIPLSGKMTPAIRAELQTHLPIIGPYKGIVMTGVNKGYEFYIANKRDLGVNCFTMSGVNVVANGHRKIHKGCYFHFITLEELPYPYNTMSNEIYNSIN